MARLGEDRLTVLAAIVCLLGVGVAAYLTYVHYEEISPACSTGGCEKVQNSEYSEIGGIPVALLGLIGYLAIGLSLLLRGDIGRATTAMLAFVGFGFSAYLTYLELFVIDAICQWCVVSAVLMTILLVVTVMRVLRAPASPAVSGLAP